MSKKTGIGTALFSACLLTLLCMTAGCTVHNLEHRPADIENQSGTATVYLIKYAGHSGIILDWKKAAPHFAILQKEFPEAHYLEFGWGDLEWYKTDKDRRNFRLQLRALFVSTSSGIFVWSLPGHPGEQYSDSRLTELRISDEAFQRLIKEISASFALNEENGVILTESNMDKGGEYRIYIAEGKYHLFNNCNTWVEDILEKSGINAELLF